MINFKQSLSVAVSSTAPFYSLLVTVPLIFTLVGGGTPLVYIIAVIPSLLVCYSMKTMDNIKPSKGTVYNWNNNRFLSWFGAYSLAITGIICTSGLAVFAAQNIFAENKILATIVATVIITVSVVINIKSVRLITLIQTIGILIQLIGAGYVIMKVIEQGNYSTPITGDISDWFHAVVLSVFAFWGFDAVFALTEESEKKTAQWTSIISIIVLLIYFIIGSYGLTVTKIDTQSLFIVIPIVVSAITAIGSTVIPTIRGIEAVADSKELPSFLSNRLNAGITVLIISILWSIVSIVSEGFFWDSIEAISILVAIYFALSCWSAYKETKDVKHLPGFILMTIIGIIVSILMFDVDYGVTEIFNIGGVGVIVIATIIVGLLMFTIFSTDDRKLKKYDTV